MRKKEYKKQIYHLILIFSEAYNLSVKRNKKGEKEQMLYSNYKFRISYKDKEYYTTAIKSSCGLAAITVPDEAVLPFKVTSIYKMEETDDYVRLYKGDLVFNINNGAADWNEVFDENKYIEFNKNSKEFRHNFDFEEADMCIAEQNMEQILRFLYASIFSFDPEMLKLVDLNTYIIKTEEDMKSIFRLITQRFSGFEKVVKSGNLEILLSNLTEIDITNEGKLHNVVGIPKVAITFIRERRAYDLYNIFKKINEQLNGNDLKILIEFIEDFETVLSPHKFNSYNLNMFCSVICDLMMEYDYKITDLLNYLMKQKILYSDSDSYCSMPYYEAKALFDYLEMSKRYNLKYDRMPQNLNKAHDIAQQNISELEKTIGKEKVFSMAINSYKMPPIKSKKYIIIKPQTPQDLIQEGNILHHCVGSYIDRIIRGDSQIYFVRKTEEPDVSFVTLELDRRNNLVQIRGFANSEPDSDVRRFVQNWLKSRRGVKK